MTPFPSYITGSVHVTLVPIDAYLHSVGGKSIVDAEVKASLALRDEVNARMSCSRAWYETGDHRSLAHLALL